MDSAQKLMMSDLGWHANVDCVLFVCGSGGRGWEEEDEWL